MTDEDNFPDKFNFDRVKRNSEDLSPAEGIKYLERQILIYQQETTDVFKLREQGFDLAFVHKCRLQIEKLRLLIEPTEQINTVAKFSIKNPLTKINYIRIINSLCELRSFVHE